MKWTREELLRNPQGVEFDEELELSDDVFENISRINGAEEVHVDGRGWLDDEGKRFYVNLHVSGVMLCPDAITNEEIEVSFDTESEETFVFGPAEDEDERSVDDCVDLLPAILSDILMEVPMQVSEVAEDEYPEGEGWKVYSEAEYQKMQEEKTDPRLAILKQFKEEE